MEGEKVIEALTIYNDFISKEVIWFKGLFPSHLEDKRAVVYAIWDKNYPDYALYVGRTKNLRRRIYTNHIMGPLQNARLKKYLIADPGYPEIVDPQSAKEYMRENCFLRYVSGDNFTVRGRIEGLLSFMLDVKYMPEEH